MHFFLLSIFSSFIVIIGSPIDFTSNDLDDAITALDLQEAVPQFNSPVSVASNSVGLTNPDVIESQTPSNPDSRISIAPTNLDATTYSDLDGQPSTYIATNKQTPTYATSRKWIARKPQIEKKCREKSLGPQFKCLVFGINWNDPVVNFIKDAGFSIFPFIISVIIAVHTKERISRERRDKAKKRDEALDKASEIYDAQAAKRQKGAPLTPEQEEEDRVFRKAVEDFMDGLDEDDNVEGTEGEEGSNPNEFQRAFQEVDQDSLHQKIENGLIAAGCVAAGVGAYSGATTIMGMLGSAGPGALLLLLI